MPKKNRKPSRRRKDTKRTWQIDRFWRFVRLPLLLIAIAFLPRVIALLELTASPIFDYPAIDAKSYHDMAVQIASGAFAGNTAFWQAPLYPYFLGAIYWLFGVSIFAAKLIQMLIGAVNCFLIFALAQRVFDRRVAWIAYGIAVFYGPFIFFSSELLAPVLLNLLILSSLLLLVSYERSPHRLKIVTAGLLLGLAQIGHGLVIAFLPAIVLWLIALLRGEADVKRRVMTTTAYLMIGFLPLIVITTVRNYAADRELVMVSANFGANFYLGNHPNYDSTTAIRPGLEWDEFIQQAAVEGHLTAAEKSSYFSKRAFDWITGDPIGFAGLLVKKAYLLSAGEEIKRNLDVYHFRSYSTLLTGLIWRSAIAFPAGLILPFAIGWILLFLLGRFSGGRSADQWLLTLFILSQAVAILLFFVSARYRLMMMPASIIIASAMIIHFVDLIRAGNMRRAVLPAAVVAVFLVIVNIPRIELTDKDRAENLFYEGLSLQQAGDSDAAIRKYSEALAIKSDYAMVECNLAQAYEKLGRINEASAMFDSIVARNPGSFIAHLVVGKARLDQGNLVEAERLLREVLSMNPYSVEAMINLGHVYRVRGDTVSALAELRRAIELDPKAHKAYNQMGAVYLERNMVREAEANFRKAYELDRSYISAMNNLAIIYGNMNRMDDAVDLLERSYDLDPTNLTTILSLGAARLRQVRPDDALALFDDAVSLAPQMAQTHHYRGIALASLRRNREAAAAFRRALQIDPTLDAARQQLERMGYTP